MATIPYATVEDVEARIGYELDVDESRKVESFLNDFSLSLEALFLMKGKSPDDVDLRLLNLVVARRGADYALMGDLLPGQTSFTETVADRSISGSVSAGYANASSSMQLTPWELKTLGLGSRASIYSIQMVTRDELWRHDGHL